ncbi:MAG: BrxA family protein [Lachnospirales bacterium]
MDNTIPYIDTLTAEQFLFKEIKIPRITQTCYKRILSLNSTSLVEELVTAHPDIAKQINPYAMMRTYRLVWNFMILVIGNKYERLYFSFSKRDLNEFFNRLQEQNDDVSKWNSSTVTKIKQVLKKIFN